MKTSPSFPMQLALRPGHVTQLPQRAGINAAHVFDADSIAAVNAALAAGRPLLLRGEPGTGKSQLAHAVAKELRAGRGLPLVSCVIDSRVEARDLLWRFDAVARLAAAQIAGARKRSTADLAERLFVSPGALFWAFDWESAVKQAARTAARLRQRTTVPNTPSDWKPGDGVCVLIDEIDKADPDVPNGLLEALGDGRFTPLGGSEVTMQGTPPLVMITSNEERALPDAFVRRCLVLELALPTERTALVEHLSSRIGPAHFREPQVDRRVFEEAAKLLDDDRQEAQAHGWPKPGQAEFLDLVRAVTRRPERLSTEAQLALLAQLARFTYKKQPGQGGSSSLGG